MSMDGGFVVGLDNGGTANNATVLTLRGHSSWIALSRCRAGSRTARSSRSRRWCRRWTTVLEITGVDRERVRAVGLDTPGPASADGVISSKGATNFASPSGSGSTSAARSRQRLDYPSSTTTTATPPRCTPTLRGTARRRRVPLVGVGDRRHRAGWRGGRGRASDQGRRRHGRRAGPHPDPDGRPAGRRASRCRAATAGSGRRRERRVADRHRATTCCRSG